jgi:maltose alpha-D-glucosyltransferase/alpha-amylase
MLEVLRFWLDLGSTASGSTPVPYLFEREGTDRREPAETHAYLKRGARDRRRELPDRVLLAEANQWPSDVVDYFGDGDECHMASTSR